MNNSEIVRSLLAIADGLEFLGDNPFKVRAYRKAAQSIASLGAPVNSMIEKGELSQIDGVGKAIAAKIEAWVKLGDFSALEKIREKVPSGLAELVKVPGLGLKRLRLLSDKLGIDTLDDLLDACRKGRLSGIKGFPEKGMERLADAIERVMGYRGRYLIDASLDHAREMLVRLRASGLNAELTGECRRTMEVITSIEFLVEKTPHAHELIRGCLGEAAVEIGDRTIMAPPSPNTPPVFCRITHREDFPLALFFSTGSKGHLDRMKGIAVEKGLVLAESGITSKDGPVVIRDEKELYRILGLPYIPAEIREEESRIFSGSGHSIPLLLDSRDVKGILHNHTTYSDGTAGLSELVLQARDMGYAWIGISDHSQSAYYAGGMSIADVQRQFQEIDELNRDIEGITIFKGVECDILKDGALDYPEDVLAGFDFVIASIHSHMDMKQEEMTGRIIRALRNPFTTILAHPCGRLLLSREPYEADMDCILKEALDNRVMVELNANPMRLDIDWRYIPGFVRAGGMISIGPDAHNSRGLDDMSYGIMMARKGLVSAENCLNTLDAEGVRRVFSGT